MSEVLLREILSEISGIKQEMSGMKQDIQFLKDEQAQIKQAVLETNERVKQLTDRQDNQHAIIDILSSRSIEHEALLKRVH